MTGPTTDQIATVQANLQCMQSLNDYINTNGQPLILNAYLLMSDNDDTDPGTATALNVVEGAFWGIGSLLGVVGNFAASFLSGMLSYWVTDTPPSLKAQFASYLTRFVKSCQEIDSQLATYHKDPVGNWNTSFTNPFDASKVALSDLAGGALPAETDPAFESAATAALTAMDRGLWKSMLQRNCVITLFEGTGDNVLSGDPNDPPTDQAQTFYQRYPAYRWTWQWQHGSKGCGSSPTGWAISEYNVGTGADGAHDGSLPAGACQYLFIDSIPGDTINPDGLYTREDVFTALGLKQKALVIDNGGGPGAALAATPSVGYLRAVHQGRALSSVLAREGRAAIEQRIVDRARVDPVFAYELSRRPREAIATFLDVLLPENVTFRVIVEDERSFGLVVPTELHIGTGSSNA